MNLFIGMFSIFTTAFVGLFVFYSFKKQLASKKYTSNTTKTVQNDMTPIFKSRQMRLLVRELSNKISIFNSMEDAWNYMIAERISLGLMVLWTFVSIAAFFCFEIWYVALFASISFVLVLIMLLMIFFSLSNLKFSRQLPTTFRITEKRITKYNSITKVLEYCLNFYPRTVRNEMVRVINALELNSKSISEEQLSTIKSKYKNKYFDLFINMLYDAHYDKTENIVIQFTHISREMKIVQVRLENIYRHVNVWIAMLTVMTLTMFFVPSFTNRFFEDLSADLLGFYSSATGQMFKMGIILWYLFSVLVLMSCKKVD